MQLNGRMDLIHWLLIAIVEVFSIIDDAPFNLDMALIPAGVLSGPSYLGPWYEMEALLKILPLVPMAILCLGLSKKGIALASIGFVWSWADDIPSALRVHIGTQRLSDVFHNSLVWYPFDFAIHAISIYFFIVALRTAREGLGSAERRFPSLVENKLNPDGRARTCANQGHLNSPSKY